MGRWSHARSGAPPQAVPPCCQKGQDSQKNAAARHAGHMVALQYWLRPAGRATAADPRQPRKLSATRTHSGTTWGSRARLPTIKPGPGARTHARSSCAGQRSHASTTGHRPSRQAQPGWPHITRCHQQHSVPPPPPPPPFPGRSTTPQPGRFILQSPRIIISNRALQAGGGRRQRAAQWHWAGTPHAPGPGADQVGLFNKHSARLGAGLSNNTAQHPLPWGQAALCAPSNSTVVD